MLNIVAPALPDACLPLGMKSQDNKLKLVPIRPGKFIFYFRIFIFIIFCLFAILSTAKKCLNYDTYTFSFIK